VSYSFYFFFGWGGVWVVFDGWTVFNIGGVKRLGVEVSSSHICIGFQYFKSFNIKFNKKLNIIILMILFSIFLRNDMQINQIYFARVFSFFKILVLLIFVLWHIVLLGPWEHYIVPFNFKHQLFFYLPVCIGRFRRYFLKTKCIGFHKFRIFH
jgi:hypothetical protein